MRSAGSTIAATVWFPSETRFSQCYCGDTYGGLGAVSRCNTICGGNPSEFCGGTYCNSVYRTTAPKDAGGD
jgi:hypothetical protein